MKNYPLIGITTVETSVAAQGSSKPITLVNQAYINLVLDFGGIPLLLPPSTHLASVKTLTQPIDGLLLIGGQDIEPSLYGQEQKVHYSSDIIGPGEPYKRPMGLAPNRQRDEFEIELYQQTKNLKKPIFGICRGLQLINVAEGGTLFQELDPSGPIKHSQGEDGWIHYHSVTIDPDSRAGRAMQTTNYFTSSVHHQGIDKLGSDLKKSAWADDNLIEIIESPSNAGFVMGVHGHVEQTRQNLSLFDRLLQAFFD